jgi:hypothetical protein
MLAHATYPLALAHIDQYVMEIHVQTMYALLMMTIQHHAHLCAGSVMTPILAPLMSAVISQVSAHTPTFAMIKVSAPMIFVMQPRVNVRTLQSHVMMEMLAPQNFVLIHLDV